MVKSHPGLFGMNFNRKTMQRFRVQALGRLPSLNPNPTTQFFHTPVSSPVHGLRHSESVVRVKWVSPGREGWHIVNAQQLLAITFIFIECHFKETPLAIYSYWTRRHKQTKHWYICIWPVNPVTNVWLSHFSLSSGLNVPAELRVQRAAPQQGSLV